MDTQKVQQKVNDNYSGTSIKSPYDYLNNEQSYEIQDDDIL